MDKQIETILTLSDINTQRVKWMEELAELIQAIAKGDIDNLVEEIADVYIIIRQIIQHYGIDEMDIDAVQRAKLTRTIKKLRMYIDLPRIRPCPTCGAEGIIVDIGSGVEWMHAVECKCCGYCSKPKDSKVKAIEAWNEYD